MGKSLMQNIYLPHLYKNAVKKTQVNPKLVLFADAHSKELPESMELIYREVKRRGYHCEKWCVCFEDMSRAEQTLFMKNFMKRYAEAAFVVLSSYFLPVSSCEKRPETRVIQLWHSGGLMKKMGYDAPDDFPPYYKGDVTANYDYVSVSADVCIPCWESAWHKEKGIVHADGLARTDGLYDKAWIKKCREKFDQEYPESRGKKVCVYAPSFSGNAAHPICKGMDAGFEGVAEALSSDWFFVYSLHPHLKSKYPQYDSKPTTEEMMPSADLLITDYSSVLFDYSIFQKPFLLFCPDFDEYEKERGFYTDPAKFPTPILKRAEDLKTAIQQEVWKEKQEAYPEFFHKFMGACDGSAVKRILSANGFDAKIDMIALDLDDTALDGHGKLAPVTRDAMKKAYDLGIEVVVASGRSFSCLPKDLEKTPFIRYAICSNGANVFDLQKKQCLKSFIMKEESAEAILAIADDYPEVFVDAFVEGQAHSEVRYLASIDANTELTPHRKKYLHETRIAEEDIRGFVHANIRSLDCMNIICFDDEKEQEILPRLEKVPDIYVTSSIPHLLEISYKDAGKESGLSWLTEYLSKSILSVAAFGNADNDAGMLKKAGLGVSVANGSKACLAAADKVIGPHYENSVADEILAICQSKE